MSVDPHLLAPDHDVGPYRPPVDGLSGSEVSAQGSPGVALPALHQLAQGEELEKTSHNIDLVFYKKTQMIGWQNRVVGVESRFLMQERVFLFPIVDQVNEGNAIQASKGEKKFPSSSSCCWRRCPREGLMEIPNVACILNVGSGGEEKNRFFIS